MAEESVIWLKSGHLGSKLSHYTINFSRHIFVKKKRDLSEYFQHDVQNVTTGSDSLKFVESKPTESQRVFKFTISARRRGDNRNA